MTDLIDFFHEMECKLSRGERENTPFEPALFRDLPTELETTGLRIQTWTLGHSYGDCARYDVVEFFGDRKLYRCVGLLLFGCLFANGKTLTLHLRNPNTKVNRVRLISPGWDLKANGAPNGLAMNPICYGYEPAPLSHLHPLWYEPWRIVGSQEKQNARGSCELPYIYLTNDDGRCSRAEEFEARNVIEGFGSAQATATMAALLLDIGLRETQMSEFCLEGPAGNWSVAIGSAELRLWITPPG